MRAVTSNAVNAALAGKASFFEGVLSLFFTPRQIEDMQYLADILWRYFVTEGRRLIIFSVGWEEAESFHFAGCMGYFMNGGGSARAFGKIRYYSSADYINSIYWYDSIDPAHTNGWIPLA